MLPSLKARHQQFIRERQYLHNVSPATVRWYTHAFKWLSLCASPEEPSQEELNAAVAACVRKEFVRLLVGGDSGDSDGKKTA
jgi:hypothetical protein